MKSDAPGPCKIPEYGFGLDFLRTAACLQGKLSALMKTQPIKFVIDALACVVPAGLLSTGDEQSESKTEEHEAQRGGGGDEPRKQTDIEGSLPGASRDVEAGKTILIRRPADSSLTSWALLAGSSITMK